MSEKPPGAEKKMVAALLGIFLGAFGAHRFYLGDTVGGIIRFFLSMTCVGSVIGLIEGVIYLTKSDEAFVQEYIQGDKKWF